MYMIMFVLDDPGHVDQVLDGWTRVGVNGATIIESSGLHRRRKKRIPMRYTYGEIACEEKCNITLFAIVQNADTAQACLDATERVVGSLDEPNTGVFSAWPLAIARGVPPLNAS